MSVAHNTGDGYTAFSGTSMATPGSRSGAFDAPSKSGLSPFEVRNYMQETLNIVPTYMGDPAGIDGCDDNDARM